MSTRLLNSSRITDPRLPMPRKMQTQHRPRRTEHFIDTFLGKQSTSIEYETPRAQGPEDGLAFGVGGGPGRVEVLPDNSAVRRRSGFLWKRDVAQLLRVALNHSTGTPSIVALSAQVGRWSSGRRSSKPRRPPGGGGGSRRAPTAAGRPIWILLRHRSEDPGDA